jgi:hypothetical protein
MNTYPPAYQGVPANWQIAFTYVKGLHEQEIGKMEQESPFFSEPAARGSAESIEAKPEDKLTPEEEEACRKFHWDPAGYLKQRKHMELLQAEKGAYARFPVPERTRA